MLQKTLLIMSQGTNRCQLWRHGRTLGMLLQELIWKMRQWFDGR
jgi:hypothetical protein